MEHDCPIESDPPLPLPESGQPDVLSSSAYLRTRNRELEQLQLEISRALRLPLQEQAETESELREAKARLERRLATSASTLVLLRDVAAAANEAESADELLRYVLDEVMRHNGWCRGRALLRPTRGPGQLIVISSSERVEPTGRRVVLEPGNGMRGRVFATGRPEWTFDPASDPIGETVGQEEFRFAAVFPIQVGDEVAGVMEFFSGVDVEPDYLVLESMASIGTQVGRVVERRRLERELTNAVAEEQRRIGRDLHDTVGQELAGLALSAEHTVRRLKKEGRPEAEAVESLTTGIRAALEQIRSAVQHLGTAVSGLEDLPCGLQDLAAATESRHGIRCRVDCEVSAGLDDEAAGFQLYRIASEAVANAVRHGRPEYISLHLRCDESGIRLQVEDDGAGMSEADARSGGAGLDIMRQRARAIGGVLQVESTPGNGTTVRCFVREGGSG